MYKIEVRAIRRRKRRIIFLIILLIVISIFICLRAYYMHTLEKSIEVSKTELTETKELNNNDNSNEESKENMNNNIDNITNQFKIDEIIDDNASVDNNVKQETENSKMEEAENSDNTNTFINKIDNIYNGTEGKRVFLTFDDGPTKEVTPRILDILDKYNIKATFFVLGNRVDTYPEIVKREYEEGHYVANHSYSHKYSKIYKNSGSVLEEYNKTEEAIRNAIGNPDYSSNLFRFPGGSHGGYYEKVKKKARKELNKDGIAFMDWSALTYDAEGAKNKEDIIKNLETTMKGWNNVVILMHDAADKEITYETLEDVIKYLQKKGYKFENIYDLMEE